MFVQHPMIGLLTCTWAAVHAVTIRRTPSMASLMLELGDAWAAVTFTTMDMYSPEGWHGTCGHSSQLIA